MNATAMKNIPAKIRAELIEAEADGCAYTIRTVAGTSKVTCEYYGIRRFYNGVEIDYLEDHTYDPWAVGRRSFETLREAKAYIDTRLHANITEDGRVTFVQGGVVWIHY